MLLAQCSARLPGKHRVIFLSNLANACHRVRSRLERGELVSVDEFLH